ncbi:acetylglutamate synthase [Ophiocordyceps camponoti-floridani]|uniref:Amino-acid acetyltransferase, mitochondrial n=1 Tax=Ophiocordyceps camponoti-floridani TaxID=2030778 RepID=A0A8H4Q6I3_9HYPO|nr:acetylglutamate synthase [Ophiocordyceps camponoti-floridani]
MTATARPICGPSSPRAKKVALDRDVIVSVLESSATRREAKGYLQKYALRNAVAEPLHRGPHQPAELLAGRPLPHVAVVKLRMPQRLPHDILMGIARTLAQLRMLGLVAVVIVDSRDAASRQELQHDTLRLSEAVDASLGRPGTKSADNLFAVSSLTKPLVPSSIFSDRMRVDDEALLDRALQRGSIVIAPSVARVDDLSAPRPVEAHETALSLIKFLNGMQFDRPIDDGASDWRPKKIASVERLIILDPLGGIPLSGRPDICHRFVNLEQEYGTLMHHLKTSAKKDGHPTAVDDMHAANLCLAKDALSLLPPSSSVLITTPLAAANLSTASPFSPSPAHSFGFAEEVTTRRKRNPLLYNLLTDKPVTSPSLPLQRIRGETPGDKQASALNEATLVKRGLPVTIYPDPRVSPWHPPTPGLPCLRLTDNCIDLPRLVHLIEDSFGRKLDAQAYVDRINNKLAGIIIAGEYEGGAIFTWERPDDVGADEATSHGRLVPYLDKFVVLKNLQGSGGMADIVFNAMVQDCFPGGVCWRSRKTNPVNKWYFERSTGTCKLSGSEWTMFWTTLGLSHQHPVLKDYEAVCRGVQPSWADDNGPPE